MSIASEIERYIQISDDYAGYRTDIRAALADKGVDASAHGFSQFAADIAAISGGGAGGGLPPFTAIETGTMVLSSSNTRPTVNFSNPHSEPPAIVFLSDATGVWSNQTNANYCFLLIDWEKIFGVGYPYDGSSTFRAASAHYIYRGTSTTSTSVAGVQIRYGREKTASSSTAYLRYWADESSFRPYSNSTSRIWVANRTHKWYALWI